MNNKQSRIAFDEIKTYSITKRINKVNTNSFAFPVENVNNFNDFFKSLPKILKAKDLIEIAQAIRHSRSKNKHFVIAMGGHVIKCGLGPLMIDMMKRKIITAIAMNGSAAIHDLEIAMIGNTSEDVAESLKDGSFGMAEETGKFFKIACHLGQDELGLGSALGQTILDQKFDHSNFSVLANAREHGIPVTVHVAIGTDIVHPHPGLNGGEIGKSSYLDFQTICGIVSDLDDGTWLNLGSAVILPEVFLKAISVSRNLKRTPTNFTTVNMDMIQHYRPMTNVLSRPGGKGYQIIGHHEIMFPLLRMAIISNS